MAIWRTVTTAGIEVKFVVQRLGTLSTGLPAGNLTITVVDPDDSASTSPTVSQTTQLPGMYKFTIPALFLTTNGVGHYGIRIGVHKPAPAPIDDETLVSLEVTQYDIDVVNNNLITVSNNINRIKAAIIVADLLAAAGSTSTIIRTNATQADDFYNNLQVVIVNTAGVVARKIDDYANTNGAITVDNALPFTPSPGDSVIIMGQVASTLPETIATAIWAKSILTPTGGSYGELVNQIGSQTVLIPALL